MTTEPPIPAKPAKTAKQAGPAEQAKTAKPPMAGSTVIAWLVGLLAVVAAAAVLQFDPPRTVRIPWLDLPLPETCSAQRMLGVDCPGCGLTRSFILTAHGRVGDAFQMHPAGTLAFIVLSLIVPLRLWQGYRIYVGRPPRSTVMIEVTVLLSLLILSFLWWGIKLASQPPWLG